jgi:tetratricopeptide (TPR) repeat protein
MSANSPEELQRQARECFERAYQKQMDGDVEEAISLYQQSLELWPTAEAHTFLGWTYSFQQRYEDAIAECHKAIEVDPDFGNPYNDIGAYLIELERWEESIPWFHKALKAPRYESYFFPHFNLGRVYEHLKQWKQAERCYRAALELNPNYRLAHVALKRLMTRWN